MAMKAPTSPKEENPVLGWCRAWDRFWFAPADPTTLGLIRVCVGLVVLYIHLSYTFDLLAFVHKDLAWMDARVMNEVRENYPVFSPTWAFNDPQGSLHQIGHGTYTWSI